MEPSVYLVDSPLFDRSCWNEAQDKSFKPDVARMRTRRFPWHMLRGLLSQQFRTDQDSPDAPEPATRSPYLLTASPDRKLIQTDMAKSYDHCKQLQRFNRGVGSRDPRSGARPVRLVVLDHSESMYIVCLLLCSLHLALDAASDPSDVPTLVFALPCPALSRMRALAHWLDVSNTHITNVSFHQLLNVAIFYNHQTLSSSRPDRKRYRTVNPYLKSVVDWINSLSTDVYGFNTSQPEGRAYILTKVLCYLLDPSLWTGLPTTSLDVIRPRRTSCPQNNRRCEERVGGNTCCWFA